MTKFFVQFPTKSDNIENIIADRNAGNEFIKEIIMSLDRIDCENETEIFIDKKNKDEFVNDYKTLENLLEIRIGSYDLESTLLSFITQNSIKIITKTDQVFDYSIKLNCFAEIDSIFTQLNSPRKINRTDFRHCENHIDYNRQKSPLIGGVRGFDNAQGLLPSAIGDAKSRKKILINRDNQNRGFIIRFEDENFENQYHAYHLVKNVNGQYHEDTVEVELLNKTNRGIPRAYKLLKYKEVRIV
jgi:hypothetical protein